VNFVLWLLNEKQMKWYVLMCLGMKSEMIKTLVKVTTGEKKTGFTVTQQKPNRSPVNGKHHTLHSQRKQG